MPRTVHVIGAGLAGLSAAVRLAQAGHAVIVHEAANQAGGRCRSYHDPALDMVIDNGNHLVLSGNRATMAYLDAIGARGCLHGPADATFTFLDLATAKRWTMRLNDGRFPWWIVDASRRVPDTRLLDYLQLRRLLWPRRTAIIGETIACKGPLYDRFLAPVLCAALNIAPPQGAAALAAAVLRETVMRGGAACRPLVAEGLTAAFVEPALKAIERKGGTVRFGRRLRALRFEGDAATALDFGDETVAAKDEAVVLAVPPTVAAALVPGLAAPTAFCGIVNAHFAAEPTAALPPMLGVVNGLIEWLFVFPGRLSVTISAANHLMDMERDDLAQRIWREVAQIAGLPAALPRWQIVRERRATFAATPQQDALRPGARTRWRNLVLAGDWTATGLPATIESAIRSGHRAAQLVASS